MLSKAKRDAQMNQQANQKIQSMSKKERAALEKAQQEKEKAAKKAAANRQKAFQAAQKLAQKQGGKKQPAGRAYGAGSRPASRAYGGGYGAMSNRKKGGPLGFLLSIKGAALVGGVGFMWVNQRELLLKLGLKYPLLLAKFVMTKTWAMLFRPILRRVLVMRSASKGVAAVGGELPGGSY